MNAVTIDSTWLTNNGPPPYKLNAADTVYTLAVDVNIVPTQPTGVAVLSSGAVASVTVTPGSKFDHASPPTVTFAAPTSGVTALGHCTVDSNGAVAVVIDNPGSGYGSTPPAVTFAGGAVWFFGEVFVFPNADGTGRNVSDIALVTAGHTVKVNGVTVPQIKEGHAYRRTGEYTARVNTADAPHTFGGTISDGNLNKPVIPVSGGAVNLEYPALYNESAFCDVK